MLSNSWLILYVLGIEDYLLYLLHLKLLEMERKGRAFELGQGRELCERENKICM